MLEWVLFLSQLGLWVMVIQLYRTRTQERQNLQLATEQKADEASLGASGGIGPLTSAEFDFLDSEAVARMATIRTLLDEIEERTHRLASTANPSIPPYLSSAEDREALTPSPIAMGEGGAVAWGAVEGTSLASIRFRRPKPVEALTPTSPAAAGEVLSASTSAPQPMSAAAPSAVNEVGNLAATGLDASSISRSTGRQLEEVNLLLHLARKPRPGGLGGSSPPRPDYSDQRVRGANGPLTDQGVRGANGPLTERTPA